MTTNTNAATITLDLATDTTAAALVSTIKAAVNGVGKYAAYVSAHNVTRDTVKHHALALAVAAYPNEKPVQKVDGKRTKFGNAVQAAGNGLRSALDDEPEQKNTDWLRLVIQAATNAHDKGEIAEDVILKAVREALDQSAEGAES
jgi:hypothetical protein